MTESKFDDLLTRLGTGKWNMLYFLTSSYWSLMIPPQFISGVYLAPTVNHTCRVPQNISQDVINVDSCSYTILTDDGEEMETKCSDWDYDTSVFSSTLTSEFNLVCNRGYLRATYQGIFMLGTFLSPLIAGYAADRFGRYPVICLSQIVMTITYFLVAFLKNFTAILIVRFIAGASNLLTMFILGLEVCEPKHRGTVGILTGLPWALGTMLWGMAAYFIRDWRYLQLSVSIPTLFIFPPLYLMDESPRWLIVKGYHEKALKVLKKAARWNKTSLPPLAELTTLMHDIQKESAHAKEESQSKSQKKEKKFGFLPIGLPNLIRTSAIAKITTIVCFDYFAVSLVFDGLNMSGDSYSTDPFLYLVLSGLVEVPGYSLTAPLIDKCGRKIPTAVCYLLCGVVIFMLGFIPADISWLVFSLALLGKFAISGSYQMIYVYSSELFPTEVRLQGIGIASMCAQLASTIVPYITTVVGNLVYWLPSVIFGVVSVIASVATMMLTETKGVSLPDTIADLSHPQRNVAYTEVAVDGQHENGLMGGGCEPRMRSKEMVFGANGDTTQNTHQPV